MIGTITNTQNANTPAIISASTALNANPARIAWNIQNVGTNPLFVLLGSGATSSVFHFVLKAGTSGSDGTGGSVGMEAGTVYNGIITIAGTNPSYVVLEIAP
jgi:hypothetical protein